MSGKTLLYQEVKQDMLNDEDFKNRLSKLIVDTIRECQLPCPIPEDMRKSMTTWADSIEAIGDGNMKKGIERMKKNHEFVGSMRKAKATTVKWIMKPIVTSIAKFFMFIFSTIIVLYFLQGKPFPWK